MPDKTWVRLCVDVDCGLRRGGWYEALAVSQSEVSLSLDGKSRKFPLQLFEISTTGPTTWTVVSHASNSSQIPSRWGRGYAVCPSCRWRQLILGRPSSMLCEGCYKEFEINWDEVYLKAG